MGPGALGGPLSGPERRCVEWTWASLAGRRVRPPLAHPVPRGVSDSAVSRAQTPNAVSTVYPVGQWRPDVESKEFEVEFPFHDYGI